MAVLEIFIQEFRDYRAVDQVWKDRMEARVHAIEMNVAGEKAVEERDATRRTLRRQQIGLLLTAVGALAGFVVMLIK